METVIRKGTVYLVGAGPGDPGLMTLRGRELLQNADVVVYDHLVSEGCLAFIHPDAGRHYVGKSAGKHTASQDEINALLVQEANQRKAVIRLKGGDPFIFGRGGEECLYLKQHGVPFEVVPGVSAFAAVPAYAGIPLTHRELSTHFTAITGHESPGKETPDVDWKTVAAMKGTLVVFMGVLQVRNIADELMRHGRSRATPAAVIRWGTLADQVTVTGTLETIAGQVESLNLRPPGLIVIGEVVSLSKQLDWFEAVSDTIFQNQ